MRVGKSVVYVKARQVADAVVLRVGAPGPSGYKTLDLQVGKKKLTDVPHRCDATGACWMSAEEYREHAPARSKHERVPASVVPESTDEGRATAGVGDD